MATQERTEQVMVLTFDPEWQQPVIPVFAGVTGWSPVEDCGFTRWKARSGQVILGLWQDDDRRNTDEIAASDAPVFEVVLEHERHGYLLAELLAEGGGTLAVLEFSHGESGPPEWVTRELDAEGLGAVIQLAMGQLP